MKKTKLTRSLLAACSIVALSAVMYGCVHNGGDDAPATDMSVTPEPVPEPMPDPGPTDLEETQTAAAGAAAAAMTASDNAAASDSSAADATMTLATLQTGDDSNSDAMGGREAAAAASDAADDAADAASEAADASAAAAAATTGAAAEEAWAMADAAQDAAEAAEATAADMAEAAIAAAMTELHIDGTVTSLGDSTVDATAGTLIDQDDGTTTGFRTYTGFVGSVSRGVGATRGVAFDQRGMHATMPEDLTDNAADVAYVQAVGAASVDIGKVLDTSDDMARLTIITAREGKEDVVVKVFADLADDDTAGGLLDSDGFLEDLDAAVDRERNASVKWIGNYYMATPPEGDTDNVLDAMDVVDPASDPVELFELTGTITGGTAVTSYARVTQTRTGEMAGRTYQAVDIMAFAEPDSPTDDDNDPQQVEVTASIPNAVAVDYSHIHFGVWAGLTDNEGTDNYFIADLGIGFVQNHDGSGVTTGHVTGTATYSGDWVAVVRPMHSTSLYTQSGAADLTANFSTDEFTGDLANLATLEGTLSGNTFAGTDATVDRADMDSSGTFDGSFSGAIYGPDGAEAAGVFSFDGGDAGAFVGAFGGRDDEQ